MNGSIVKNYLPAVGLLNAFVQWFKPHTFIKYNSIQSLMLYLCRNFKLIVPTVVLSSFWIFDWDDSEYRFYELTPSRRALSLLRLLCGHEHEENDENNEGFDNNDYEADGENEIDHDDNDDDDDGESDNDAINSCIYMEEFNSEVDIVYHYDSPIDLFGYYIELN